MRKFLGTILILALIVGGLGIYRGWFSMATSEQPGKTNIEIKIDKDRIKEDAEAAKNKAKELTSRGDSTSAAMDENAAPAAESPRP